MIYYRVCYFNFNSFTNKWEIIKEYPLSENTVWSRVDYLTKSILSLVWLEEVKTPSVCEDCKHFDWDIEKCESYCDLHRTSVPWDWSCEDFDFME
ncbi:hypothetical protein [Cetobacterium sp.]|uniref:hypothetical protein n=1 Tax=Cetobacterium sp. TaxID=2071632 RepID=UPI003EE4CDB9